MKPELTVVISTYNRLDYLQETVNRVLAQTFDNLELVLCDDGSNDGTDKWASTVSDPRFIYKYRENSGEPSFPRNMGIENAKGDFVAFLDSDDVWEPDKIEKQMPLFSNPATGLAYCGTSLIDAEGNPLPSKKTEKHSGNVLEKLLERNFIACSGVIVRKKLLTENGLYFLPGRKAAEDWDLWLRLAMITEFDFVDEPLVKYRSYPESISRDCRLSYNSTMVVIREISGEIRRRYSEGKAKKLLNILRRNRMNHDIALARSLYAGGEHGGAACVFFRTFLSYISGK